MAGTKFWFSAYGKKDSDRTGLLKMLSGRTASEIENEVKGLGGRLTLLDCGMDDFFGIPFVKVAFEFPEWGPLQRNSVNGILAELLNRALSGETDLAFQFNPIRDEDPDGA